VEKRRVDQCGEDSQRDDCMAHAESERMRYTFVSSVALSVFACTYFCRWRFDGL